MIIRPFRDEDAQELSELIMDTLRKINSKDYDSKVIEALVPRNSPRMIIEKSKQRIILVAEINNAIVGTVGLDDNQIRSLFVRYDMLKRGIGKKLIREVEEISGSKNMKRVFAHSSITAKKFQPNLLFKFRIL